MHNTNYLSLWTTGNQRELNAWRMIHPMELGMVCVRQIKDYVFNRNWNAFESSAGVNRCANQQGRMLFSRLLILAANSIQSELILMRMLSALYKRRKFKHKKKMLSVTRWNPFGFPKLRSNYSIYFRCCDKSVQFSFYIFNFFPAPKFLLSHLIA